jgi:hypothetical protein
VRIAQCRDQAANHHFQALKLALGKSFGAAAFHFAERQVVVLELIADAMATALAEVNRLGASRCFVQHARTGQFAFDFATELLH